MTLCLYLSPSGGFVLEKDGRAIDLPRCERRLLAVLASEPDRVWTRDDLECAVWGGPDGSASDAYPATRRAMHHLRGRLGWSIIDTRRPGGGYRLGAAVRVFSVAAEVERAPVPFPTHGSRRAALSARLSRAPGAHPAGEAA